MRAVAPISHTDTVRALRDAGWTALLAFGLFLPLIGFQTVQNINRELVLDTRFGLLAVFVAIVGAGVMGYFATHIGFYSIVDGMETMGIPPVGFSRYPGGHLLSYDLATGRIDDLATAPQQEGVLTMNVDGRRQRIYALTWPGGWLFRYDIASRTLALFIAK